MPDARPGKKMSAMASHTAAGPNAHHRRRARAARLEHRARRLEYGLAALRRLADTRAADGPVPAPLRQAIGAFAQDLAQVRRRLSDL
jgi:hypothetical protein